MESLVTRLNFLEQPDCRVANLIEFGEIFRAHDDLGGHVQPDHSHLPGSGKDHFSGMWVVVNIRFSRRRDVSQSKGAATHQHHFFHQGGNAGFQPVSHGNVGQRTNRGEDNLVWVCHDGIDNELGSVAWIELAMGKRKVGVA